MKALLILFGISVLVGKASAQMTVHEWGTFTTLSGSNGQQLQGLYHEEEQIPYFVHSHPGFKPFNSKGSYRACKDATLKMETPVMYFYNPTQIDVNVRVGFPNGSISQWYPQRSDGEAPPTSDTLDLSGLYKGWILWNATVLSPETTDTINTNKYDETPTWTTPRGTDANLVKAPSGEVEKFLFYRGVGNLQMPIVPRFNNGALEVFNSLSAPISYALVFERTGSNTNRIWWSGHLAAKENELVTPNTVDATDAELAAQLDQFVQFLVKAGLYQKEAQAMLDTWKTSYFQTPGVRIFWIVPRMTTDEILPLQISPKPATLERVLVGRSEVLTPQFEDSLMSYYNTNGNLYYYYSDRYYLAYLQRVNQLLPAAVSPVVAPLVNEISLFPNPFTSSLKIEGALQGSSNISITDILGQVYPARILKSSGSSRQVELDLSRVPSGTYFVKVQTGGRTAVSRAIKY